MSTAAAQAHLTGRRSVIGKDAAIGAAEYHRDRATSSALYEYWDEVASRLKRGA